MLSWLMSLLVSIIGVGVPLLYGVEASLPAGSKAEVKYLVDSSGSLDFGELAHNSRLEWKDLPSTGANFGFRNEPFWFRVPLPSCSTGGTENVLELAYPLLDSIELWFIGEGIAPIQMRSGDGFSFRNRPIDHLNFGFPYDCKIYTQALIRIQTTSAMQVPIQIWKKPEFVRNDLAVIGPQLVYFGAISIMAIYNFFIFISPANPPIFSMRASLHPTRFFSLD